jgi:hypothetical protein
LIYNLNKSSDLGAIAVLGILLMLIALTAVILVNRLPCWAAPAAGARHE